jgi:hypothetical protein
MKGGVLQEGYSKVCGPEAARMKGLKRKTDGFTSDLVQDLRCSEYDLCFKTFGPDDLIRYRKDQDTFRVEHRDHRHNGPKNTCRDPIKGTQVASRSSNPDLHKKLFSQYEHYLANTQASSKRAKK